MQQKEVGTAESTSKKLAEWDDKLARRIEELGAAQGKLEGAIKASLAVRATPDAPPTL
jgi:hypothetical protein